MVSKKDKKRMSQFITNRIENSKKYNIHNSNEERILLNEKTGLFENPSSIYIFLNNKKMTINEYNNQYHFNKKNGIYSCNIFYKDGKNFMVRLAQRGHFKGDNRSLKYYGKKDRDKMIHLRALEKEVLYSQSRTNLLSYYQPKTERLEESIRNYVMEKVRLEYSHIDINNPGYGFTENKDSLDYKIAENQLNILGPIEFKKLNNNFRSIIISNSL
jgi:hypothetical protein